VTATADTRTVRYRHAPDVLWRATGDSVLLMLRQTPRMLTLNGSGAAVWFLLARPRSVSDSAELLAGHFDASADGIERDIAPLIEELATMGALVAEVEQP
jgi:hypothetical protein